MNENLWYCIFKQSSADRKSEFIVFNPVTFFKAFLLKILKPESISLNFEFKKNDNLKKSGLAGLFSASLELTKEGLISIMQKKNFNKILIKAKKWPKKKI